MFFSLNEKVFLKEWHRDLLDGRVTELHKRAAMIQKHYKGYRDRQRYSIMSANSHHSNDRDEEPQTQSPVPPIPTLVSFFCSFLIT